MSGPDDDLPEGFAVAALFVFALTLLVLALAAAALLF